MGSPFPQPHCCPCTNAAGVELLREARALLPNRLPQLQGGAAPGETNPKWGRELSRGKFQVCKWGISLAEEASSSCVPASRRGRVTGCREKRRKRQENQEGWGREHRTGSGRGGGFTEQVSWLDPAGWHQVLRPRRGRSLGRRWSFARASSPRCHNYGEAPASTGGRGGGLESARTLRRAAGAHRGPGAADGTREQGGSLPPSRVYKQIKN